MAKATIKMIAEMAGVSRGTVDRVLNNRPYVKEDIALRVREVVKELNYIPNAAAKALRTKKDINIGVIMQPESEPYITSIKHGVERAKKEYAEYGVNIEILHMNTNTIEEQSRLLLLAEEKSYNGVALAPFDAFPIRRQIAKLMDNDIPVATFSSEVKKLKSLCYVGQDDFACGRLAAQLMSLMLGNAGNVVVSMATKNDPVSISRLEGFKNYMEEHMPEVHIEGDFECFGHDGAAYKHCRTFFQKNSEINGIFVMGEGLSGICRYLNESGKSNKVKLVCAGLSADVQSLMRIGLVHFAIGQQYFQQGYYPIKILTDYILKKIQPTQHDIYTPFDIRTSENIDYMYLSEGQ